MSDVSSTPHKFTNRLSYESSPYLLQHAHNPVDWYPWGPEAFEKARREDKPIFLSVGYSTCYWCHVMERQSFENEQIAAEMNRLFVNIKVDREERPDVDQLYMTAVQLLTRHGGWPMSVWLTPDLRPFYGGTYFPPDKFVGYVRALEDAYRSRRSDVNQSADQITDILGRLASPAAPDEPLTVDQGFLDTLIERSVSDYEPQFGGFGSAPKFPRETLLELLLVYLDRSEISDSKSQVQRMLRHSLTAMAEGGIRDQLGGGFHRYSTDARWLVPHFEIMLYDNAMLGWIYSEAARQFDEPQYAQVARGIFDFTLREMTSPQGAFYTAFDAEVDAQEGLSYLWTAGEIEQLLGPEDGRLFNRVYGVDRGPNFADPHHGSGQPDKNILYLPRPLKEAAKEQGMTLEKLETRLEPMRRTLYEARLKRKQPLLDTKILTSWNALMIRALAHAGNVLGEVRYTEAARLAAEFLLKNHRMPDGGLFRTSRDGRAKYAGFVDDYAYLAQALLTLGDVMADKTWKQHAAGLAIGMLERFVDPENGGFFFTDKDARDLIVRQKTAQDSPLPSGNAVAAMALLDLGQEKGALTTLAAFARQMADHGESMSSMVQAALLYVRRAGQFKVSASPDDAAIDRPADPKQIASGVVKITPEWNSPAELHLKLGVLEDFHINAHDPGGSIPLIPTNVKVDVPDARIDYPPGEEARFAFTDAPIRVYSGEVTILVRFPHPPIPESRVRVTVSYQACDESACFPPVTKQMDVDVPSVH